MSLTEQAICEKLLWKMEKLLRRLQCGIWQWGIKPINSTKKYTIITGKDSLLLGYDAASMGNQILTF